MFLKSLHDFFVVQRIVISFELTVCTLSVVLKPSMALKSLSAGYLRGSKNMTVL